MTQEQKDLLLKDLSARLPYGVICNFAGRDKLKLFAIKPKYDHCIELQRKSRIPLTCKVESIKPYLFPMSSITEERRKEWYQYYFDNENNISVDWLNKYHFDYRGLIPMGLALDATGLNIY